MPVLPAITDQLYVQGAAVDFTLPAATGGDSHPSYAYTLTPDVSGIGLTFTASTRKLGGTPSTPKAKVTYTYTATESSDSDGDTESAEKTFTIGIQPKKPAGFTAAAASDTSMSLGWTAIPGVSGWQVKQDSGGWTAISGSGAATSSHTVTGLASETRYTFRVRAVVGTGAALVEGVESDAASAATLADLAPSVAVVPDMILMQGASVNLMLPAATGGDGHPSYTYTLTPDPSGIGLTYDAAGRTMSGTLNTPLAKTAYTYTAAEASDPDGTAESVAKTFTIGVQPKQPANFSATADGDWVTLAWDAISGVDGWQYQRDGGDWIRISGGGGVVSYTLPHDSSAAAAYKVRAFVGTTNATRLHGVTSDARTVAAASPPPSRTDYDVVDDGLIEITTTAQLEARRLDWNGDGRADRLQDQAAYDRAFPNAARNMGCNQDETELADQVCTGYELDLSPKPGRGGIDADAQTPAPNGGDRLRPAPQRRRR